MAKYSSSSSSPWEAAIPTSESQLTRLATLDKLVLGEVAEEADADFIPDQKGGSGRAGVASPVPPSGANHAYVERILELLNDETQVAAEHDPLQAAATAYTGVLEDYAQGLSAVATQVDRALTCLGDIEDRYQSVSSKAESLNGTCETLLNEQKALEERKALLAGPMEFFDELERLGPLLGISGATHGGVGGTISPLSPSLAGGGLVAGATGLDLSGASSFRRNSSVGFDKGSSGGSSGGSNGSFTAAGVVSFVRAQPGSEEFVEILKRIDKAIDFFQNHPQYRDSSAYLLKMRTLQLRGLGLVKNQAIHLMEGAVRAASSRKAFDNLETSLIYSKFRAISSRVHDLVMIIDERVPMAASHLELLEDCKKNYTQKRWHLLKPVIRSHLENVVRQGDSAALARTGSAALSRICQLEAQLYDAFFGTTTSTTTSLEASSDEEEEVDRDDGQESRFSPLQQQGNSSSKSKSKKKKGKGGSRPRSPLITNRHRTGSHEYYDTGGLYELLIGLCLLLHDLIRPLVIHEHDLDNLCQLINVVREEILEGQAPLRGRSGVPLEGVLDRIAKDAQERLIYAAEKMRVDIDCFKPTPQDLAYPFKLEVMRVDIECFKPTPQDLDYPSKLDAYWSQKQITSTSTSNTLTTSSNSGEGTATPPSRPSISMEEKGALASATINTITREESATTQQTPPVSPLRPSSSLSITSSIGGKGSQLLGLPMYATWFPTLHVTLTLLSKIYRAVEIHVFQDMAQSALSACNESLLAAAKVLREQKGDLNADLFLVKHLLILREQLVPFDIEFAAVEKRLDFKSTRGALTKFFVDTRKMFRMGADNALYSLALDSIPTVHEDEIDSKKQLEESLKWACNAFIQHASNQLADPLISLLKKAEAFLPQQPTTMQEYSNDPAAAQQQQETGPDEAAIQHLLDQPFMQHERVEASLVEAHELLASAIPALLHQMSLYLDYNSMTKAILFKPVRLRVLNVVSQLRDLFLLVMGSEIGSLEGLITSIRGALNRVDNELLDSSLGESSAGAGKGGGSVSPPTRGVEAPGVRKGASSNGGET